jgi:broad specificity polyphosphatase/5'/3'-nucleotidase SurE
MGFEIRIDVETLEDDSDIHAVVIDQVVAVTPLTLDMTARVEPKRLNEWLR